MMRRLLVWFAVLIFALGPFSGRSLGQPSVVGNPAGWAFPVPVTFNGGLIVPAGQTLTMNGNYAGSNPPLSPLCTTSPEAYGAKGDGVTDDLPAFNTMTAALVEGGSICLAAKTYFLNGTWVIQKSLTILGAGIHALYGSDSVTLGSGQPSVSPYLVGSVLLEGASNADAVKITEAGANVNLFDFGVKFSTLWTSTGHGIEVLPPALSTYLDTGLSSSTWQRLMVYGHDGNHYAFQVENPQYDRFLDLFSWGGGGLKFGNNSIYNFGNSTVENTLLVTMIAGSAHAMSFRQDGSTGIINLFTCIRCQTAVISSAFPLPGSPSPATGAQKYLDWDASHAKYTTFINPDWEGNVGSTSDLLSASYTQGFIFNFVLPSNATSTSNALLVSNFGTTVNFDSQNSTQAFGFQTNAGGATPGLFYAPDLIANSGGATAPTVAAGTANGTTPPAPVIGSSANQRGLITFGSGTGSAAGQQVVVTFGYTYGGSVHPTVVLTANNAATQALGLYLCATPSQSSFAVCSVNAPAASQGNTIYNFSYIVLG